MEIHWYGVAEIDEEHRQKTERKLRVLSKNRTDLIDVRIAARSVGHARSGDNSVRITCQARGAELVATGSAIDPGQALDRAVDSLVREVRKLRARRRMHRQARGSEPETEERGGGSSEEA